MIRKITLLAICGLTTGCMSTTNMSASGNSLSSNSLSGPGVIAAMSLTQNDIVPAPGIERVTLHAHRRLLSEPACAPVISIGFSSTYSYAHTVTALRNRALTVGANAVAVTSWAESRNFTYMVGHFFDCTHKRHL